MKVDENLLKQKSYNTNDKRIISKKQTQLVKSQVSNFLIGGEILIVYNQYGGRKEMHVSISSNMKMITAQEPKSTLKPKDKNILEIYKIKQIIKGFGTSNFEKFKSFFFRAKPKPECCFSIIEGASADGVKSLNVECESAEKAEKWVNYLEELVENAKKGLGKQKTAVIR